jgi:hypothetical protein
VERLLCVDGWEETTGEGEHLKRKQEMTLVVLKFVLATKAHSERFRSVTATLAFQDFNFKAKEQLKREYQLFLQNVQPNTASPIIEGLEADKEVGEGRYR